MFVAVIGSDTIASVVYVVSATLVSASVVALVTIAIVVVVVVVVVALLWFNRENQRRGEPTPCQVFRFGC